MSNGTTAGPLAESPKQTARVILSGPMAEALIANLRVTALQLRDTAARLDCVCSLLAQQLPAEAPAPASQPGSEW